MSVLQPVGQVRVRDCALVAIDASTICSYEQFSFNPFDFKTFNPLALFSPLCGDMIAASVWSEHCHPPNEGDDQMETVPRAREQSQFGRRRLVACSRGELGGRQFNVMCLDYRFSNAGWSIQRQPGFQIGAILYDCPEAGIQKLDWRVCLRSIKMAAN
jgi:hypothetical protein